MGKPLNQQRRGKGSPAFTAPSHLYNVRAEFRPYDNRERSGIVVGHVISFVDDSAHSGILMRVQTDDGIYHLIAPEGIAIGDAVQFGSQAKIALGNALPLSSIPDGTPIYNIELTPGDGGSFVRAAGSTAYIVARTGNRVTVRLPSKKVKEFDSACRAEIGIVSAGGRLELPFFKAGKHAHAVRHTAKYWPHVRGVAMNPVDHPFGGSQHHPGRSTCCARGAPPGQKVGLIGAGSVGRGRGKKRSS
jgi:large subunit ribosomal protein L2